MKQTNRPKIASVYPLNHKQPGMTPHQALLKAMDVLFTQDSIEQVKELARHFENKRSTAS